MKKDKIKFSLTRGLAIGAGLFIFFHMYRILLVTELSLKEYFASLEPRDVMLEAGAMLISGIFLGFYVRKQMDNLKKARENNGL